jgi:hypothetical protein
MNAKEKAVELIDKMYYSGRYDDKENYSPAMAWDRAKQCALIAVEEILTISIDNAEIGYLKYWNNVKSELQSL